MNDMEYLMSLEDEFVELEGSKKQNEFANGIKEKWLNQLEQDKDIRPEAKDLLNRFIKRFTDYKFIIDNRYRLDFRKTIEFSYQIKLWFSDIKKYVK